MCAKSGDDALVRARKTRTSRRRGQRLARPAEVAWTPFRIVDSGEFDVLINSRYRVEVALFPWSGMSTDDGEDVQMTRLIVTRVDLSAVRDWTELQRIKTELCGADSEAVELFPAESRRVDHESNRCYLWVMPRGIAWPVGFTAGVSP